MFADQFSPCQTEGFKGPQVRSASPLSNMFMRFLYLICKIYTFYICMYVHLYTHTHTHTHTHTPIFGRAKTDGQEVKRLGKATFSLISKRKPSRLF